MDKALSDRLAIKVRIVMVFEFILLKGEKYFLADRTFSLGLMAGCYNCKLGETSNKSMIQLNIWRAGQWTLMWRWRCFIQFNRALTISFYAWCLADQFNSSFATDVLCGMCSFSSVLSIAAWALTTNSSTWFMIQTTFVRIGCGIRACLL